MSNITQDFAKGMVKDMYDYGMESYDAIQEVWPMIFAEKEITGDHWQMTSVVTNGALVKTLESQGFQARDLAEGYTVVGRVWTYTDAICISKNLKYDLVKLKNLLQSASAEWGESVKLTREEFYGRFFNKGGITTGDWIFCGTPESQAVTDASGNGVYDGTAASPIPFFNLSNNTRSSKGGGTYYNGYAYNLDVENLKTRLIRMRTTNNRSEGDSRIVVAPNLLVVPGALEFTGEEILGSNNIAHELSNTDNSLKNKVKLLVWDALEDTDASFLGCAKRGLIALKRQEPKYDMFEDKLNRCFWATVEARFGGVVQNWRFWDGSNMATS